jgi:hypothetical protein
VFRVSPHFIVETGCGFRLNLICCELQFCLRTAGTCNEELVTDERTSNFRHVTEVQQGLPGGWN